MKQIQKLIIPFFVGLIILTMYLFYFSPFKGLGSFKDFDPDSHAQKEIDVKVVHDLGIQLSQDGSKITFFAEDRNGSQMPIQLSSEFKSGIENSEVITMTGHLCSSGFEVVNVELNK